MAKKKDVPRVKSKEPPWIGPMTKRAARRLIELHEEEIHALKLSLAESNYWTRCDYEGYYLRNRDAVEEFYPLR